MDISVGQVFGFASESLFFVLFFTFAMCLKKHLVVLFFLTLLSLLLPGILFPHLVWTHVVAYVLIWLSLFMLYRAHYGDIVFVLGADIWLGSVVAFGYLLFRDNVTAFILWFTIVPIASVYQFRGLIHKAYLFFQNHWDRKPGLTIKSVTLRHLCVIFLCIVMIAASIVARYMIATNY